MTLNSFVKSLIASLVYSTVVLTSIIGRAQDPTPTANWVNIKSPAFGAFGDGKHDDTAAIQAAIDYAFNHNLSAVYCPAGTYRTSRTIYLDPPGNLRSNLSNPTNFAFSISFFGDPGAAGNYQGCRIEPTFNNDIAFLVGTGQGMRVSDIAVIGPDGGYRGAQPSAGVGIGLSGGNGGSSTNLVENTYVANFYTLYMTDANNACCLSDSNTFRKVSGDNGYYGIRFYGTQNNINDVVEPRLAATIDIDSEVSRQVNVYGGNLSATSGQNASFRLSSISSLTATANCCGFDYTVTAALASPDQYVGTVYDSYTILTSHFGLIPMTMTAWNSGTQVGTFKLSYAWAMENYGGTIGASAALQTDIQAVTTLYAAERVVVAKGNGISMDGVHIENPSACQSVLITTAGFSGDVSGEVKNPFFNSDPSQPVGTANQYCQAVFPFIGQDVGGYRGTISLEGGTWNGAGATLNAYPLLLQTGNVPVISGSKLNQLWLNEWVNNVDVYGYTEVSDGGQFATVPRGAGQWDNDYFLSPAWASGAYYAGKVNALSGDLTSPFCGYEPCPWTTPNMSPTLYAKVSGTLGALGSYAPVACRTVFKSVDWNSTALTHLFLRSASCPGYSYGQHLTDSLIGGTVTWSYIGGSNDLYLDAKTLSWMFSGLGISINNGNGAVPYIVTGIFPQLGYVTVIKAANNYPYNGPLAGTNGTVYSCASSCIIGQAAYLWTAY